MAAGSPHLFLIEGRKRGIPDEVLQTALTQAKKTEKYRLPSILTLRHFSYLSDVQYTYLREIVARKRHESYRIFSISKWNGGRRRISVPEPQLLISQQWISKNILTKIKPHTRSFAYSQGSSILKCAQPHCGCRWLIKIDVKNFFESISEINVYNFFRKYGYQPLISFELSRICTRMKYYRRASEIPELWKVRLDK